MTLFYDEEIKQRMAEAEHLVSTQDEGLFPALSSLLEEARLREDRALQGFVHYQYASAYFDIEESEKMMDSVRQAISCLIATDEREWISRTFNLFAVYVKQMGCLDMAYNYLLLAYSFVGDREGSLSRSIIEANLGDILADKGDFRKACTYVRKSLKTLKKGGYSGSGNVYEALGTANLGLFLLYGGDTEKAKKTLEQGGRMLGNMADDNGGTAAFWHMLVEAQIDLAEGKRFRIPELTNEISEQIRSRSVFALFTREIQRFGIALIRGGELAAAGVLIDAIEKSDVSASPVYSRLMLAKLKVDFYREKGEREALEAARGERHRLMKELSKTQKQLFLKSAKLMLLENDVRKERDRIRIENERLQEQAQTDALTGLPNRYALNEHMELAFDKALRQRSMFGFGIVDIDAFKQYNDTYGHAAGDECLIQVANTLKEIAAEYGFFVSRYGGDEFTMLYENIDHETMKEIDETILARVSVSVSHGYYADIPDENSRRWDYLTRADQMMYIRKRGHR